MPIYKPSELKALLIEHGLSPNKALSQNFLIDGNVIRKIADTAHVLKGDLVLEIGPGPGALTEELLTRGAKVVAVEKDDAFAQLLHRFQNGTNQIEVYHDDIMDFPIEKVMAQHLQKGQKAKVIANLPYHLTTPIIAKLIQMSDIFSSLVVMIQEEVAQRYGAVAGSSDYGSITLFLNFYSTPKYAFHVKKSCFLPSPKVDSAIMTFTLKEPPHVSEREKFFEMTRTAFQMRRKMLRSSLKELYGAERVTQTLEHLGYNPQARPEELSLEQFLKLFEKLNEAG